MSFCCEGTATDGRHSPDCLAMKVRWPPTPPTGGAAARREVVTLAAPPTNSSPDWLPTADNINALPEPLRKYIADIETNADPAGMVAENVMLKDENAMLRAKIAEAAPPTPTVENRIDALLIALALVPENDKRRGKHRMVVAEHMRLAVLDWREVLRKEWNQDAEAAPPTDRLGEAVALLRACWDGWRIGDDIAGPMHRACRVFLASVDPPNKEDRR